jgi:hypothetical protein
MIHPHLLRASALGCALAAASLAPALTLENFGPLAPTDAVVSHQHDLGLLSSQTVRFRPFRAAGTGPNTSGGNRTGEISDKGQTFITGANSFNLGSLTLQLTDPHTYGDLDTVAGSLAGASFSVSFYQVNATTNGAAPGPLLFTASASLPTTWNAGDFLRLNFSGAEQVSFAANSSYAFLLQLTSLVGNLRFDHSAAGNEYAGGSMFRREFNTGSVDPDPAGRGNDANFNFTSDSARDFSFYVSPVPIPEPASAAALLGAGLLGWASLRRRRA